MSSYDASTTAETVVSDLSAHIADKVILITGVSPKGLGAHFVEQIAKASSPPKLVVLAGRDVAKAQVIADAVSGLVETRLLQLDLESLEGTRAAAAIVNGWDDVPYIDVLVNNAGVMAIPYAKTADGFERTFAVNHLSHFLFTNLIMPKILKSPSGGRVVSVSSEGHRFSWMRWPDVGFKDGTLYNKWRAYGQSKTANILFAVALAKRIGPRGLVAISLHPGAIIETNLSRHFSQESDDFASLQRLDQDLGNRRGFEKVQFKTLSCGTATHVVAAFEPRLKEHNGAYLLNGHVADPYTDTIMPHAVDKVEADKLWKLSEELVGESFSY